MKKNTIFYLFQNGLLTILLFISIQASGQSPNIRENLLPMVLDSTNPLPPSITLSVNTTPTPGAIFLANFGWGQAKVDPHLLIVDNDGTIIQKKYLPGTSGTGFRLQPNGLLSYYSEKDQKYYLLDSSLNLVKIIGTTNGYQTDNHELLFLPNGNYILIALTHRQQDMTPVTPDGSVTATIVGNNIQEYDGNGNLLFEWISDQHFQITDATHEDLASERIDYCHANAVEVDHDGNWLLSSRHMDEITKINSTTGDIIWRWGGKHNQFTFINDTIGFSHQHSIRVLPNGHYVLFDNGNYHVPAVSRVCEYIIDTTNMTATLVREFRHTPSLFSFAMGSVQYLDNGNWLIGWGSNQEVAVTEVTPSGETALEMSMINGNVSYRAYKFPWQKPLTIVSELTRNSHKLQCYPNPSSTFVTIDYEPPISETATVSIIDCLGRIVDHRIVLRTSTCKDNYTFDISSYPQGAYQCRISDKDFVQSTVFVKR